MQELKSFIVFHNFYHFYCTLKFLVFCLGCLGRSTSRSSCMYGVYTFLICTNWRIHLTQSVRSSESPPFWLSDLLLISYTHFSVCASVCLFLILPVPPLRQIEVSVCPYFCLSVRPYEFSFFCLFILVTVRPSAYPFLILAVCPFVYLSVLLSVRPTTFPATHPSVPLSVRAPFWPLSVLRNVRPSLCHSVRASIHQANCLYVKSSISQPRHHM